MSIFVVFLFLFESDGFLVVFPFAEVRRTAGWQVLETHLGVVLKRGPRSLLHSWPGANGMPRPSLLLEARPRLRVRPRLAQPVRGAGDSERAAAMGSRLRGAPRLGFYLPLLPVPRQGTRLWPAAHGHCLASKNQDPPLALGPWGPFVEALAAQPWHGGGPGAATGHAGGARALLAPQLVAMRAQTSFHDMVGYARRGVGSKGEPGSRRGRSSPPPARSVNPQRVAFHLSVWQLQVRQDGRPQRPAADLPRRRVILGPLLIQLVPPSLRRALQLMVLLQQELLPGSGAVPLLRGRLVPAAVAPAAVSRRRSRP